MRIFQTFVLPDALVAKHKLSFAAANFSRNLLNGGGFEQVYSLIPVNVRGELEKIDENGYEVIYSSWRKKGGIIARMSIFAEQWKIFRKIKRNDSIWFYNLNFINALLFSLLKIFKPSVKLNVIVLDFTPANNWKEQNFWFLKLINSADGAIYLSSSSLFKVKNSCILPGVVPSNGDYTPQVKKIDKQFLLSGVICETISMTQCVLEAFAKNPACKLHITGKVLEGEDIIKKYAAEHPNIIYHGSLSFDKYVALLDSVTFQLSTRNPEMPENQCNFPSKIIEALLHNRIVVSTIHYPQLAGIKYLKLNTTDLLTGLTDISNMTENDLLRYANQSEEVRKRFGTNVWNENMTKIEENSK